MRTTIRHILILALAAFGAASCAMKEDQPQSMQDPAEGAVQVRVFLDGGGQGTKSSYGAQENGINDLCLFVFDGNGVKVCSKFYTSTSGISLSLRPGTYTIKALANMGDITSSVSSLGAYESFVYSFNNDALSSAFPMSGGGQYTISAGSTSVSISLERLVAKFTLSVSKAGIRKGSLTVKSVVMKNIAGIVRPSSPYGVTSSAQLLSSGDSSSSDDIALLDGGGSTVFYVPENMQGTECGITQSRDKVPQFNYTSVRSGLCTYLEVACSYYNGKDELDDIVYRMYLGANATSSFDIARNTSYTITLTPDSDHIYDSTWKCDNDMVARIYLIDTSNGAIVNPALATVAENCYIAVRNASGQIIPIASCTCDDASYTAAIVSRTVGSSTGNCATLMLNKAGVATYHITTSDGMEFDYPVTANKPVLSVSSPTSSLYLDGTTIAATATWKKADGTVINPTSFFNASAAQKAFITPGISISLSSAAKYANMNASYATTLSADRQQSFESCLGARFSSPTLLSQVFLNITGYDQGNLKTMLDALQSGGYFGLAGVCTLNNPNITFSSSFTVQMPWTNRATVRNASIDDYSLIPEDCLRSGLSHSGTVSSGILPVRFSSKAIPVSVTLSRAPYPAYSSGITYTIPAGGVSLKYAFNGSKHPAGRHTVVANITNSVSGETIDVNLGYLDCYTHIPIGTRIIISSIGEGGYYYDESSRETLYPVVMYLYSTFPWRTSSSEDYPIYYLYTQMKSSSAYKAMIQGSSTASNTLYQATKSTGLENPSLQWMKQYETDWYEGAIIAPSLTLSGTYVVNGKRYSGDIGRISNYLTTSYANAETTPVGLYYTERFAYMYYLYDYTGSTTVGAAGTSARYAHAGNANYKDDSSKGYYIIERMGTSTKYHDLNDWQYGQ